MRSPRDGTTDDRGRLTALHELGKTLLSLDSRERVAEAAVRHAREVVPVDHVALILFEEPSGAATLAAAFAGTERLRGSRWERDAFGPVDRFGAGAPVVLGNLASVSKLPPGLSALARAGIRSAVEVPMVVDGEVRGLLVVGSVSPSRFGAAEVSAFVAAMELVGPAIERAAELERARAKVAEAQRQAASAERRLHEQGRLLSQVALSQEQERQRLAVDIHDDTVQVMTVVGMRMQTLRERIPDAGLRRHLDEIDGTVRQATQRLRHLMFELLPPTLDREGLAPALSLYLERVRGDSGVAYVFESRVHGQPATETRTALYRIAQEAVRNVIEHAKADLIEVLLDRREGGVWMRVSDDGRGFSMRDVESRLPLHLGLTAMRQHAELVGGWCRVHSVRGGGTTVEAWVPAAAEEAAEPQGLSARPA
jgi:signal transduction histidine kinase